MATSTKTLRVERQVCFPCGLPPPTAAAGEPRPLPQVSGVARCGSGAASEKGRRRRRRGVERPGAAATAFSHRLGPTLTRTHPCGMTPDSMPASAAAASALRLNECFLELLASPHLGFLATFK